MTDWARACAAVIDRVLSGPGETTVVDRRAAFDNRGVPNAARALIDKVAKHAYRVTDEDVASAKAAGLTEDQVFELVIAAALGQASRQYEAALATLNAAEQRS
jgi:alkylhydroperoxidase family enzyme